MRVDIICGMEALDFSTAWKSKIKGKLIGVPVHYIGIKDLLTLKKSAGRPQDLVDIMNLKKVLKQRKDI